MKKLYIAGSSKELERVKKFATYAKDQGFMITEPWWDKVEEHGANPDIPRAKKKEFADADIAGLEAAECVILLAPADNSGFGCAFEYGYAIAKKKPVVIAGKHASVFCALRPTVLSDNEALGHLETVASYYGESVRGA